MAQSIRISKQLFNDHTLDSELENTIESGLPELETLFQNLHYDPDSRQIVVSPQKRKLKLAGLNKTEQVEFARSYLKTGQHIVAQVVEGSELAIVAWQLAPTPENIEFVLKKETAHCRILNRLA